MPHFLSIMQQIAQLNLSPSYPTFIIQVTTPDELTTQLIEAIRYSFSDKLVVLSKEQRYRLAIRLAKEIKLLRLRNTKTISRRRGHAN